MSKTIKITLCTAVVGLCMNATALFADEFAVLPSPDNDHADSLYYQQQYRPNPRAIVHQKAQARAQQRQARMASLGWYGVSGSRPATASTPFTSNYNPVLQTQVGWPLGWHSRVWPTYVVYMR
jgi:hypothetical protein